MSSTLDGPTKVKLKLRYRIQIEADLILDFAPWEGCDADAYAEQIGYDSLRLPITELGQFGTAIIDSLSVHVEREPESLQRG